MNLRRVLTGHLGSYRAGIVVLVVLQAVQTTAGLLLPSIVSRLIQTGVLTGDRGEIWRLGGVMVALSVVQVLFAGAAMWFGAIAAMGFGREARRHLFRHVASFSAREVGRFGAPSLITRITNDVQQIQTLLVMVATMMITAPLTMVVGIVLALREDAGLSVVLLVAIPIEVLALGSIVLRMVPAFQQMQGRIDRVNAVLREQITGVRVVRAFTREPQETRRFAEANDALTEMSMRAARLMAATFPTVTLVVNVASVAVLWIGADRVGRSATDIGSLVAFLSYLLQVLMAVVMVTFMMSMIPRAAVSADRIMEVLETTPSVAAPESPLPGLPELASVEFDDVSFRHPGAEHPVLDHLTFRVEPGSTTAIIGSTGSGKTTLLTLAGRLVDPTAGAVRFGGVDLRELDPHLVWTSIGYVPQRAYLFSGTVASNLRFGRADATDEELWAALETAQAAGFVQAMPNGLDSEITQGGGNVSGGQRQRLAIARAVIARPRVYLFDDCFSALDLATEARVRAALAPLTRDAAVLVVAQRISTVQAADQILVLEDGELVGIGTHDELLATCPTYGEIAASQLGEEPAA